MHIDSGFDGGNITVTSYADGNTAYVTMDKDGRADFRQWFAFRCVAEAGEKQTIVISNAGECNRIEGWEGSRVVASYDRVRWFRVPTRFDGIKAQIDFCP